MSLGVVASLGVSPTVLIDAAGCTWWSVRRKGAETLSQSGVGGRQLPERQVDQLLGSLGAQTRPYAVGLSGHRFGLLVRVDDRMHSP